MELILKRNFRTDQYFILQKSSSSMRGANGRFYKEMSFEEFTVKFNDVSIKSLKLCNLNHDELVMLTKFLENNTTLRELDVSKNNLRSGLLMPIITALKSNNTLECLNLYNKFISSVIFDAIDVLLDTNTTLQNIVFPIKYPMEMNVFRILESINRNRFIRACVEAAVFWVYRIPFIHHNLYEKIAQIVWDTRYDQVWLNVGVKRKTQKRKRAY